MPAGLTASLTKASVDLTVGVVAQRLNECFRDVEATKIFLDSYQDDALAALEYTPEEIANIRSAYADLDMLRQVYEGLIDAPQKDFRLFAQRIWGTGFIV